MHIDYWICSERIKRGCRYEFPATSPNLATILQPSLSNSVIIESMVYNWWIYIFKQFTFVRNQDLECHKPESLMQQISQHKNQTGQRLLQSRQYSLHTVQFVLQSGQFILRLGQFFLHTGQFVLQIGYFFLQPGQFFLHTGQFILQTG